MVLTDRIGPLCDLLLGAAYADRELKDVEDEEVREMLVDLSGAELTTELEHKIASFDPETFDLTATAAVFKEDPADDRRRLLFLVAAINDVDEETDLAEDDYLRALGAALELPAEALAGLTLDIEIEDLRQDFAKVRRGPPPIPGKRDRSVDVDL
ncbi:MAG: TerB family tellurite resistance protein [Myxococcales bacterium]|nr:TerB family tellurite resistance protein [Myxococcales bacterium]